MRSRFILVLLLFASLHMATASFAQPASILLTHASLIDGTGTPAVEDVWIRVTGTTIAEVGTGPPPAAEAGVRALDLSGKTVLPGLSDMHVHLGHVARGRWMLKLLLAHGVTNVKETGNTLGHDAGLRRWAATPEAVPHLYVSGTMINGSKDDQRFLQPGPALAAQLEDNFAFGAEFIKLHNFVSSAALKQIVQFGREHDLPVTGHTPLGMTSVSAIDRGMTILEHVRLRTWEVIDDPETIARYPMDIPLMIREGFWGELDPKSIALRRTLDALAMRKDRFFMDPTLVVQEALAYADVPARAAEQPDVGKISADLREEWKTGADAFGVMNPAQFQQAKAALGGMATFVGLALARGIRMLTGTDTPLPWLVPGASLLHELELLVQAGLRPEEVIHCSTGLAAAALRCRVRGVIARGQEADLVIVRGNVSESIGHIKDIEHVMLGGRLHERTALLAEAAALAAADPVNHDSSR